MALETVGLPRLRKQADLAPGIPWYRITGEKTDGTSLAVAMGCGVTPEQAWSRYQACDPFVFQQFDDDIPF